MVLRYTEQRQASAVDGATQGQTPWVSLNLTNFDWYAWHTLEHDNWRIVDAVFGNLLGVKSIDGVWQHSIVVVADEVYVDADLGTLWKVLIGHTTASTGTFAEDRTANPTYWVQTASGQVSTLDDLTDVDMTSHDVDEHQALQHIPGDGQYKPVAPALLMPVGMMLPHAGQVAPIGILYCDGRSLSTTTYADLFAVIGYEFGGSGANFNLPNTEGVVIAGTGPSNIHASTAGSDTHTLTVGELPPHTHNVNAYGGSSYTPGESTVRVSTAQGATHQAAGGNAGDGDTLDMRQATLYVYYGIVYTNNPANLV